MRAGRLSALALLLVSPAAAQNATTLAFLQQVNAASPPPAIDEVARLALIQLRITLQAQPAACTPSALALSPLQPATGDRMLTQAINAQQLTNGWTTVADLRDCPTAPPLRLIVLRMPDGSLKTGLIGKGESLAGLSLTRDATRAVLLLVAQKINDVDAACKGEDIQAGPTRIVDATGVGPDVYGVRYAGKWKEEWRVQSCGWTITVPIDFTADGNGGAYYHTGSDAIVAQKQ